MWISFTSSNDHNLVYYCEVYEDGFFFRLPRRLFAPKSWNWKTSCFEQQTSVGYTKIIWAESRSWSRLRTFDFFDTVLITFNFFFFDTAVGTICWYLILIDKTDLPSSVPQCVRVKNQLFFLKIESIKLIQSNHLQLSEDSVTVSVSMVDYDYAELYIQCNPHKLNWLNEAG